VSVSPSRRAPENLVTPDTALVEEIKRMKRPVAVIIDAGCISAGETLARDFKASTGARLFGSTTAGSSSSKKKPGGSPPGSPR
jgi:C-terminal processing protease CtpA/Prc